MTSRAAAIAAAALVLPVLAPAPAEAAEVQFEGYYRTRGRLFDTLSLNRQIEQNEGLSWYFQHRLWLRPKFFITDQVGIMLDIRGLDGVYLGNQSNGYTDFVGLQEVPALFVDDLRAPVAVDDAESFFRDFSLWRAWGEVHTRIGTFKFGRQPLDWGMGIWQNDGTGYNMDFGDTADRISWEHQFKDVWIKAAVDIHTEGLINETDDTTSFNLLGAYRTERIFGGLNFQYRHRNEQGIKFDLFSIDGAFDLQLGMIGIEGEVIGQFGNGDLEGGRNDVNVLSVGAVLDLSLTLNKLDLHVEGGMATGDGDPDDNRIKTFTFDRDYNVGFILFEQAMPVLQSQVPGEDRSYQSTLTGHGVSNALYLRPAVSYEVLRGFFIDGAVLMARTAKVSEQLKELDRRSYGFEIDVGARYKGVEHFDVGATFGTFIPGTYYRNFSDDRFDGFRAPVFGGQLIMEARF